MKTLIKGGQIINEGRAFSGSIVIDGEQIADIVPATVEETGFDRVIDAKDCIVIPGVIDSHVHFREPGLTRKACIDTESRAAAAGGVTTFFDMPNTVPQTTTLETLEEKFLLAGKISHVNYSFFFGATNDNSRLFPQLDTHRIPGIKLFMGSSTGNMLVDEDQSLDRIFQTAPMLIMAHCEDSAIIGRNMAQAIESWGEDPPVHLHPLIRSEEACLASTTKAIALARKHGARLHVAHISTAEELELIAPYPATNRQERGTITAEATVGHLFFTMLDHQTLGARIKVNPAIKSPIDQFMLREALTDGRIACIGTDHAPHLLTEKQGGCARAASGMPMIQFSLPAMLELADQGVLTLPRLVELMCHQPARLFQVRRRGYLRKGYQADITIIRRHSPWTVTPDCIESRCKWSALEGHTFQWRVEHTLCNGHLVYHQGVVDSDYIGQPVTFR